MAYNFYSRFIPQYCIQKKIKWATLEAIKRREKYYYNGNQYTNKTNIILTNDGWRMVPNSSSESRQNGFRDSWTL